MTVAATARICLSPMEARRFFGKKVRLFEALPRGRGVLRRLDGDLPLRSCWLIRAVVGKAPHLAWRDFGQAATAAEAQGVRVSLGILSDRRHKIVPRRTGLRRSG